MDAIITAAGKNTRMINDFKKLGIPPIHKLELEINNKPILVHTIEKLEASNIDNITVALGYYKNKMYNILEEYDLIETVNISINSDVNVGLSKTIQNALEKSGVDGYYFYMAADQPTITVNTINRIINQLDNSPNKNNTISVLARRKTGKLDSAEGLGMPFCSSGRLLYNYLLKYDENLNPLLREMISDGVEFYGIKEENELELLNINHYKDYTFIKEKIEKKL
ncbi:MAG: NTP transferase domain-containing protein [Methanosphaera sp.]|nr:NTP transferase domain-containing protein [Methanosphaera sp.]